MGGGRGERRVSDGAGATYGSLAPMEFLTGVAASIVAGLALWTATNQAELRYALKGRRRNKHLSGLWNHYHVSRDPVRDAARMWVHHDTRLSISSFGRVTGLSCSHYGQYLSYKVSGNVRGGVMRLFFENLGAEEDKASAVLPSLLAGPQLVGILVAQDFERDWFASPVILSRDELTDDEVRRLARKFAMLVPPT